MITLIIKYIINQIKDYKYAADIPQLTVSVLPLFPQDSLPKYSLPLRSHKSHLFLCPLNATIIYAARSNS